MPYNDNVPQVSQSLGQTQSAINTNFNLIQSTISVNHFPISAANAGKHTIAEFINQNSPITAASESTIYANSVLGVSNLFFRPEGQGVANAGPTYQLTRDISAQFAQFSTNAQYGTVAPVGYTQTGGWTFLPGGMLLQYGFYGNPGTGGTAASGFVQFPTNFTNVPYSIQATIYRNDTNDKQVVEVKSGTPPTISGFTYLLSTSTNTPGFFWVAIGV